MSGNRGNAWLILLVIVAILAAGAAVLLSRLPPGRRPANEPAAIASLQTIHTAQRMYRTEIAGERYGSLATLSSVSNPPYLDILVGSGTKSGYYLELTIGAGGQSYSVRAVPVQPGVTGRRYFYSDSASVVDSNRPGWIVEGVIRWSEDAGVDGDSPPLE